jgi:NAD(P)-dependent dehydrogenase (short-subunit alcohol dehydrogenase family)
MTTIRRVDLRARIGRPGRADELEGALLFLASGASTYGADHDLVVDGGWTCLGAALVCST